MSTSAAQSQAVFAPPVAPAPETPATRVPVWTFWHRFGFRVAFVVFTVWTLRMYSYWIQIASIAKYKGKWYEYAVTKPGEWMAQHIFNACPGGSRSLYYCWAFELMWLFAAALVVAGIWTVLDRKRPNYQRLHEWLRTGMRYALAGIIWGYAYDKFVGLQFGRGPEGEALHEAMGDTSPMQVMWSTMGYSFIYGAFTGVGEAVGTILLFFRRTTTLGALIVFMIMANVTVLDIMHRHSISEAAFIYMLMAMFLVIPDARRLFDFYFSNRPIPATAIEPQLFPIRWPVKALVIGYSVFFNAYFLWPYPSYVFPPAPKHPLQGIYTVDRFVRNGDTLAARLGDSTRWERAGLGIDRPDRSSTVRMDPSGKQPQDIQVRMMDGNWKSFGLMLDTGVRRLVLTEGPAIPGVGRPAVKADSAKADSVKRAAKAAAPAKPRVPVSSPLDTIKRPKVLGTGTYTWEDKQHLRLDARINGAETSVLLRRIADTTWTFRGGSREHRP